MNYMKIEYKKIILCIFILTLILFAYALSIKPMHTKASVTKNNVDENKLYTKEWLDLYFSGLDDSELVLQLPEGGFISGPPNSEFVVSDENGNIIETYIIASNPKSETVAEAKKRMLNQPMNPLK